MRRCEDFHAHIPGFEPFRQGSSNDEIFHNAVRENLTHDLGALDLLSRIMVSQMPSADISDPGSLNRPLSAEAAVALQQHWSDNPGMLQSLLIPEATTEADTGLLEWHEIELKSSMLHIISQLSSRVFLGTELCRNPDWLRVTRDYTVDAIQAAQYQSFGRRKYWASESPERDWSNLELLDGSSARYCADHIYPSSMRRCRHVPAATGLFRLSH